MDCVGSWVAWIRWYMGGTGQNVVSVEWVESIYENLAWVGVSVTFNVSHHEI